MANIFKVVEGGTPLIRAHRTDAGYDLTTRVDAVIQPGETMYIPSGVAFELDTDYCVNVMPRSSSFKWGVIVTPTLIDSGYTSEISTIATNISKTVVRIPAGSRLAQCRLEKVFYFDNNETSFICDQNDRNDDRFGSSG